MGWIGTGKPLQLAVCLKNGALMPTKAHENDAGFDLYAPKGLESGLIRPDDYLTIDTGVCIAIPPGFVGMIKSKSGLNVRYGITSEGVIDAGYTGSIVVKLYNNSRSYYNVEPGEKISQLVIVPIPKVYLTVVDSLGETDRGDNGFGSSGRF